MNGAPTVINVVVMEGITTALVLFVFVSVIIPTLIKNRPQFYAGFGSVCLIVFLQALRMMLYNSPGFQVVSGVLIGLLQLVAIIVFFLSAGGSSFKDFRADMGKAFEVIRRGEEEKEIIIPRSDMPPRVAAAAAAKETRRAKQRDEDEHHIEEIDLPPGAGWPSRGTGAPGASGAPSAPTPPDQKTSEDKDSIPLE